MKDKQPTTLQKINILIETGDRINIGLGLQLAQNEGLYEAVIAPYTALGLWLNRYMDQPYDMTNPTDYIPTFLEIASLNLRDCGLEELPPYISKLVSLTMLNLSKNKFQEFPISICEIKGLKVLYLGENQLTSIPEDIGQLTSLEILDLECGQLKNLPKSIEQLTSLQILKLSGNQLEDSDIDFGCFKALEEFSISSNLLRHLPKGVERIEQLTMLFIARNQIETIPELKDGDFKQLYRLDLEENHFKTFPMELRGLDQLDHLDLEGNSIEEVVGLGADDFKGLSTLQLDANQLTCIPPCLQHLIYLQVLELDRNPIEVANAVPFDDLTILSLANCGLKNIDNLSALKTLYVLDLSENPAIESYDVLTTLKGMNTLYLKGSNLDEIPKPVFALDELEVLDVANNNIETVVPDFKDMKIKELYVSYNKLSSFPFDYFTGREGYLEFHLDNNRLTAVSDNLSALKGMHINRLYLNDNQIRKVPDLEVWEQLKGISYFNLDNNPLEDEVVEWVEEWVYRGR